MKTTLDNIKKILENELKFKTIVTDTISEKNTLFIVGIKFSKTKLQMIHITDIESDIVILNFDAISKVEEKIEYSLEAYKSMLIKIEETNKTLKMGNFGLKMDDDIKPTNLSISYRLPLFYEDELSENLYKKVFYIALKTISEHAPKLLDR